MRKTKPIQAELIEFLCDECKRGYMRVVQGGRVIHSNPKQWQHQCSSCGNEAYLTFAYPVINYKSEDFMLAKHVRFQTEIMPMQMKDD